MSIFQFKQFAINQDRCAMKIGSDSLLLGAWTPVDGASHILDIGTGTGLLALMLAQRNPQAKIEAVELEEQAFLQAKENLGNSPWAERLKAYQLPIQQFNSSDCFDVIISNPPYFEFNSTLAAMGKARNLARSTEMLSYEELLGAVARLLCPDKGIFSVVLPIEAEAGFIRLAAQHQLYICSKTNIIPREGKPANRVLISFSKKRVPCRETQLCIREAGTAHHNYTEEYRTLLKNFLIIF